MDVTLAILALVACAAEIEHGSSAVRAGVGASCRAPFIQQLPRCSWTSPAHRLVWFGNATAFLDK